jgi:hypothetical protein
MFWPYIDPNVVDNMVIRFLQKYILSQILNQFCIHKYCCGFKGLEFAFVYRVYQEHCIRKDITYLPCDVHMEILRSYTQMF